MGVTVAKHADAGQRRPTFIIGRLGDGAHRDGRLTLRATATCRIAWGRKEWEESLSMQADGRVAAIIKHGCPRPHEPSWLPLKK